MTTLDPARHQMLPSIHDAEGKAAKSACSECQAEFGRWLLQEGPVRVSTPPAGGGAAVAEAIPGTGASEEVLYRYSLSSERPPPRLPAGPSWEGMATLPAPIGGRDAPAGTNPGTDAVSGILHERQLSSERPLPPLPAGSPREGMVTSAGLVGEGDALAGMIPDAGVIDGVLYRYPLGSEQPLSRLLAGSLPEAPEFLPGLAGEHDASIGMTAGEPDALIKTAVLPAGASAREGVLYEWQLRSQQSLSQFPTGSPRKAAAPPSGSATANPGQPLELARGGVPSFSVLAPAVMDEALQAGNLLPLAMPTASGPNDPASSRQTVAALAGAMPSALWTERLLRTVEAPDRSVTVWLRDYRLDEEQLPAMLDEILRTHADGERIARVVVNGNEVWRKNPLQSRSE